MLLRPRLSGGVGPFEHSEGDFVSSPESLFDKSSSGGSYTSKSQSYSPTVGAHSKRTIAKSKSSPSPLSPSKGSQRPSPYPSPNSRQSSSIRKRFPGVWRLDDSIAVDLQSKLSGMVPFTELSRVQQKMSELSEHTSNMTEETAIDTFRKLLRTLDDLWATSILMQGGILFNERLDAEDKSHKQDLYNAIIDGMERCAIFIGKIFADWKAHESAFLDIWNNRWDGYSEEDCVRVVQRHLKPILMPIPDFPLFFKSLRLLNARRRQQITVSLR